MTSVRCLLAVAVIKGWSVAQLDVNNTFLYGDLDEEVYIRLPPGFEAKGKRKEAGLDGAKPVNTPIIPNHKLALAKGYILKDLMKYRRIVGRLIYLTITRPDLVYSVHILSQFVNEPRKEHLDALIRVVRYIKGTPSKGIIISKSSELHLYGFSDSDWGTCPMTRRSLTGYFVALGDTPISWKAKKQATVAKSSAEAEYRAMAGVTSELLWLKAFLRSVGVNHTKPMDLY
ncbi:secreted RxLR effector protein 161-like [Silene latifolia]|uniref:secreted RxLR effector protein 161-like n=1 Tax=Silene latifolia TaxID=37657 RepID=UPI003D76FEFE